MWKEFSLTFLQYGLVYAVTGAVGVAVLFWMAYYRSRSPRLSDAK